MRTIALRRGLAALLVAALSYGVQADEKSANTLRSEEHTSELQSPS